MLKAIMEKLNKMQDNMKFQHKDGNYKKESNGINRNEKNSNRDEECLKRISQQTHIAKEGISQLEDRSKEITQTERQRVKRIVIENL